MASVSERVVDIVAEQLGVEKDKIKLETLLPVIWEAVGNRTFSVRELFDHAELDIPASIALRDVLEFIGSNPRAIGRLLGRGTDIDVCEFRIVESGPSREGMLRTIIAVTRKTRSGD